MNSTTPRSPKTKLIALLVSLILGLLVCEVLLRLRPTLLPMDFRAQYPMRGIEFLRPHLLDELAVDELSVPLVSEPFSGIPPADLKQYGIAPRGVQLDAERYPRVHTPSDALGLPNPGLPSSAEVVLVGDSMLLAASSLRPPGLVQRFAQETGLSCYSLGVPGIGPQHEASLLAGPGLSLKPKLVLWFFFGGNDLNDAKQVLEAMQAGKRVRSELDDYRSTPFSYLFAFVNWALRGEQQVEAEETKPALPPLLLPSPRGEPIPLWLHPSYLARTALTRGQWEAHKAWAVSTASIAESHRKTEAQGGRFVLVYLPSKAEALLPLLAQQEELLWRTLNFDLEQDLSLSPGQALAQMLAQRGSLDAALGAFCEREGIPYFSASAALEAQARAGEAGYFATDTHWMPTGQAVVLEALLRFLETNALLAH